GGTEDRHDGRGHGDTEGRRDGRGHGDTEARRHGGTRTGPRPSPNFRGRPSGRRADSGNARFDSSRLDVELDGAANDAKRRGVTETRRHGGTATLGPNHDQVRTSGGALQDFAVIPITTVSIADGWTSISTLPPSTRSGAMSRSRKSTRDASRAGCLVESRTRA